MIHQEFPLAYVRQAQNLFKVFAPKLGLRAGNVVDHVMTPVSFVRSINYQLILPGQEIASVLPA